MTPQQKCDLIEAKHGKQIRALFKYLVEIIRSRRNLDHCATKAIHIADEMAAMVAPYSACKKGCAYCCHQATIISSWEAKRIALFTRRAFNLNAGIELQSNNIDAMREEHGGTPCPFLKDNRCSIYEVRPFMCRLHFSLDDDNVNCDTVRMRRAVVPYFNFEQTKTALAALFVNHGNTFADIREFFGNENV